MIILVLIYLNKCMVYNHFELPWQNPCWNLEEAKGTSKLCILLGCYSFPFISVIPDKAQLDMPLDELTPLRLRDMVFSPTTTHGNMARCLQHLLDAARSSSGVILNTFQDLEDSDIQKITSGLGVLVYTIGPLHKISSGTESSLLAQDQTCLKWLDKQEADSVLYVSLGSLASMDEKELLETASGLANSQSPFLWVIRHNMVRSEE